MDSVLFLHRAETDAVETFIEVVKTESGPEWLYTVRFGERISGYMKELGAKDTQWVYVNNSAATYLSRKQLLDLQTKIKNVLDEIESSEEIERIEVREVVKDSETGIETIEGEWSEADEEQAMGRLEHLS